MTAIYPYNTRTNRIDGASFPVYFSSATKDGVAELVEGYEFSSSSSSSSVSSSSSLSSSLSSLTSYSSLSSVSSSSSSLSSSFSQSSSGSSGSSISSASSSSIMIPCVCENYHMVPCTEPIAEWNIDADIISKIGSIYVGNHYRPAGQDCTLYLVVKRDSSNIHHVWLITDLYTAWVLCFGGHYNTYYTIGYGKTNSIPGTVILSNGGSVLLKEEFTFAENAGWTLGSFVRLNCINDGTIFVSTTGNDSNDGLTPISPKLTIQGGIDAASIGDTVLVDAGTYNLTHEIDVGKEVYIRGSGAETTIIDGGYLHNGVLLTENSVISDMTIQHCIYGIRILYATAERCIVCDNTYGILLGSRGGEAKHCLVTHQTSYGIAMTPWNGMTILPALLSLNIPAQVINCTICDNGGGLRYADYREYNPAVNYGLKNIIANNIMAYNEYYDFNSDTSVQLQPIYQNNITGTETFVNRASGNYRLQAGTSAMNAGSNDYAVGEQYDLDKRTRIVNYIVDVGAYEYGSLNYYYDVYASPGGNDLNDGRTVGSPKRTIQAALGVCMQGGTVHLSSGTFVLSTPVTITGNRKVDGASAALTIIDGNDATRCIDIYDGILQNVTVKQGNDSGIVAHPPTTTPYFATRISKCVVEDCYSATYGGGIQIENWTTPEPFGIIVDSCLIHHNTADAGGGGIYVSGTSACTIHMCTICKNSAPLGGGIYSSPANEGVIYNSIVRLNLLVDIYGASQPLSLMYTCYGSAVNIACTGASCGSYDPLFENETLDDFHLQSGSPCVEAGWSGDAVSPDNKDLDGNPRLYAYTYDLGAYERQS